MNLELLILGGYGQFVWPAFIFTFVSCFSLYVKTKKEFQKLEKIFLKEFKQIKKLTSDIRLIFRDKKYPILTDQEGGRVNRLNNLIEASVFTAEYFGNLYKKNKYKFYNYYLKINLNSYISKL